MFHVKQCKMFHVKQCKMFHVKQCTKGSSLRGRGRGFGIYGLRQQLWGQGARLRHLRSPSAALQAAAVALRRRSHCPLPLKLLPLPPAACAPPKTAKGAFSRKLPKPLQTAPRPLPPANCPNRCKLPPAPCPLQTAQTAANCPNQPRLPLPCRFIRTSLRRFRPENRTAPTPPPPV